MVGDFSWCSCGDIKEERKDCARRVAGVFVVGGFVDVHGNERKKEEERYDVQRGALAIWCEMQKEEEML